MFKKIMICLDGSELARQAIPYGVLEANKTGAQVILCRAVSDMTVLSPNLPGAPGVPLSPNAKDIQDQFALAETYLENEAARIKEATGIEVQTVVNLGMEGGAIITAARENDIDLIILSTHGTSGLERAIFGSTANYIIRESGLPCLVIRPEHVDGESDISVEIPVPKKIMVGLDGSHLAEQILPFVTEQARSFGSRLDMVQVVEAPGHEVTVSLTASKAVAEKENEHYMQEETDAMHYLSATADSFEKSGLNAQWSVLRGEKIGPAIVAQAKRDEVDMIAMCTHGRSGLNRAIFGSVADWVLRHAGLPILIFKPWAKID